MRLLLPVGFGCVLYLSTVFFAERFSPFLIFSEKPFLINTHDDQTHVAFQLRKMKFDPLPNRLVVVGSSSFREAFNRSDLIQSKVVNTFPKVKFANLSTSSQSLAESWNLIDNLDTGKKTLVLLGVNPIRFRTSLDGYLAVDGYGFSFPRERDLVTTHINLKSNVFRNLELSQFLLLLKRSFPRRIKSALKSGDRNLNIYESHHYDDIVEWDQASKLAATESYLKSKYEIRSNMSLGLEILSAIKNDIKSREWQMVLVEGPMAADLQHILKDQLTEYEARITNWAVSNNIKYIRPQDGINFFEKDDFYDFIHLRSSGRKKYEDKLLQMIQSELSELASQNARSN